VHDPEGPDAEHRDEAADVTDPDEPQSCSGVDPGAVAPVSEVDAEDEVAKAEARAEAARARLLRLRQAAETGDTDDGAVSQDVEQRPAKSARKRLRLPRRPGRPRRLRRPGRPRWLRRPGRKTIAVGVGIVLASTSLAGTGYMLWQHHTAVHNRQLAAEFTAAARQGITALMSIDPDHAKEDVQRMIDDSTGDQKSQLSVMSTLIVKKAEDSKVGSTVTVEAVAVESLSDNSGVVLVAAKTAPTGPDNAKPPPALFRLSVNMDRDGGQLKMSKVDFLP
jgi:Mce-associated membrane protein